ncbi:MAG: GAF domain-containing protein [Chloroflexota bacterium]
MPNANPEIIANPERLARLRRLCLLDTPTDPGFDRLTRMAAHILKAPISTVTLVDDHRQFFKSQVGIGEPWASLGEMPLEYSYCQHVVATRQPLIVEDSRIHPLLYDNRSTLEEGLISYAGVPLLTSEGDALGSFCVIDKNRRIWTDDEIDILTELSELVMTEIELREELIRRKETEEALRKSEQNLYAVITGAPIIVYLVDQDGIVLMSEGKGLKTIGITPNRIIGQSIFDVFSKQPEVTAGVERALEGGTVSVMTQQETKIGLLHYEVRISPNYDSQGKIIGAISVANDVTDRVLAEQTLEQSIQRLTFLRRVDVELSESLDLDSVLTIAMDTALRATSAKHAFIGLIEGNRLRAVHATGEYQKDNVFDFDGGVVGRALQTQEPQLVLDVDHDPDFIRAIPGTKAQMSIPLIHREHLIGALSLETENPELFTREAFDFLCMISSHVTVAIDNSQLYQVAQQQLEEMHHLYMRISELEQLKTDMIRIAAHDLRNPLGIIKGYTALLLEDKDTLTPDQFDFMKAIDTAGEKMLKIIGDILSLQRVETMQDKANCDEINLHELIQDIAAENEFRARRKNQDYQVDLPESDVPVCVDLSQVREALDNLIGNAIKYTPDNGKITIRLVTEGSRAVFEVKDSGYGIPPAEQTRLFQPFFRASNAKASDIEGTGLGLHLVKNIVERHGGKMRFQSVLGAGSTFGFDLPKSSSVREELPG